ncbi:MAG: hypothetical protein FWE17_00065 [Alphaproteobacteria bacterium]|nr:hypothetical protein [Alphaproteobacteria bacterium]MCL2757697.1 hypothetical protein [Alphaproteobacteria bacterium]
MKNLIIIGPTRSGKSTLAEMVRKRYGFSKIELDSLVDAFKKVFPGLGIGGWIPGSEERLAPFIFHWFETLAKYSGGDGKYVMEGVHMYIQTAFDKIDHNNTKIIVLGYPNALPDEMLAAVRKNDKSKDWSAKASDEDLLWELRDHGTEKSKRFQAQCKKLGIRFIDTGTDRMRKLQEFVDDLEEFLK